LLQFIHPDHLNSQAKLRLWGLGFAPMEPFKFGFTLEIISASPEGYPVMCPWRSLYQVFSVRKTPVYCNPLLRNNFNEHYFFLRNPDTPLLVGHYSAN
jgi:hypothetical protein